MCGEHRHGRTLQAAPGRGAADATICKRLWQRSYGCCCKGVGCVLLQVKCCAVSCLVVVTCSDYVCRIPFCLTYPSISSVLPDKLLMCEKQCHRHTI